MTTERDPDEIILTSRAGVGGAGRIPIYGRLGDGAAYAGELRELEQDDDGEDSEQEPYDFSIGASIRSNAMAWRQLTELKGAIMASPESAGRDHALKLIDLFDAWFESGDDRLQLMLERQLKAGGAQ